MLIDNIFFHPVLEHGETKVLFDCSNRFHVHVSQCRLWLTKMFLQHLLVVIRLFPKLGIEKVIIFEKRRYGNSKSLFYI